ncbi:hypothetical protein INP77_08425 [Methylophilus sp. 13]|uniref:hypothetical protein n=1 Tax=Methylophilus sp. 13 TaxID=2781018 RepID=UPI00188F93A0|nr:hypothetical protein [Methylophilus sp. 13]MBF5039513.1 hypothetical protein [Methylophilus sp. 13]
MGWKGTVRSINAAYRAAERDSKRRHRELQRQEKEYAKMQLLDQAVYDVDAYENHLERFLSIHKESISPINWIGIKNQSEPKKPPLSSEHEDAAKQKEAAYKPSWIDRLFGLEKRKRTKLASEIKQAIEQDVSANNQAELEWMNAHAEWAADIALAEGILKDDAQAKLDAIRQIDPFSELTELGSELKFSIDETGLLECELMAHGKSVIPDEIKSLLSSGKLSVKKMPITKFYELYQDYVCGCALRIANELFSILQEDKVVITVIDTLLNTSNGHLEEKPILSVLIPRVTMSKLNMVTVDPSDSMSNFIHNMSFNKKTGFSAVSKVNLS